ncbi:flagellar biosynthetic protein FliO [Alicyclobacillus mali]|uniref:Flagellar biosynthetic protein FliO n=1 Tax=Alicyclobacillus mali (ex Roth et al. 2021) TaxID=1123961 RepID=A0ABS0F1R5_9BACL|nr:flagellar biosynthetic protein FliO [Alicyclobacillus mali (ex Roth et al. 2021)]MBF8377230.1 flagellar biosynthetic protein FliO [Alicyclobacillus mali (ex Roth et al. 2021)]MCL6488121.1 flagellar biosynthetic protein FliO [Alicyclobacillus mali (ex Roth et al. 2021)]
MHRLGRWTAVGQAGSALAPAIVLMMPRTAWAAKAEPIAASGGVWAYIQLVVALVLVLLLIAVLFRVLGRRAGVAARGQIEVVAARQVAPNKSVQVVQVGERLFLIGVGEDVRLLADVTDAYIGLHEELADDADGFGAALREALERLRERRRDE